MTNPATLTIHNEQPGYDAITARKLATELGGIAVNARYRTEQQAWEIGGWAKLDDRHIVVTDSPTGRDPYTVLADNLSQIPAAENIG